MLSIAPLADVEYHARIASDGYYQDKGEATGRWFGLAAEKLGLRGKVEIASLSSLFAGFGLLALLAGRAFALLLAQAEKLSLSGLGRKRCNGDDRRNYAGRVQLPLPFSVRYVRLCLPGDRVNWHYQGFNTLSDGNGHSCRSTPSLVTCPILRPGRASPLP